MMAWFEEFGARPRRIVEMTSYSAILGSVAAGMGVGIVPMSLVERFPERKTISLHPIEGGIGKAAVELLWLGGAGSVNIKALRDVLLEG